MLIERIERRCVSLPLARHIAPGQAHEVRSVDCVLVRAHTSDGLSGEGLAFTLNGFGLKALAHAIDDLEPLALGPGVSARSFSASCQGPTRFFGGSGVFLIAQAAIDAALWDAQAKTAGLNVAELLGSVHTTLPVYDSGSLWAEMTVDELQASAQASLDRGFRALKMRLGAGSMTADAERVRAVREVIGDQCDLMVDSNQRWTRRQAIDAARSLEEFDLHWFEEPVRYDRHADEAAVRNAIAIQVASGESVFGLDGIQAMLAEDPVDVLMPDLQRVGGPTGLLAVAAVAGARGLPIAPHLFHEMNLSLLSTIPNASYLEYMPWFEPVYAERLVLDGAGRAVLSQTPGWGFSFDPVEVARCEIR